MCNLTSIRDVLMRLLYKEATELSAANKVQLEEIDRKHRHFEAELRMAQLKKDRRLRELGQQ